MSTRVLIGLFACLILAQWAVPVSMILKREVTLRQGEPFLFKTAPIDPYDPFRGRYVRLDFEETSVPETPDLYIARNATVYVRIENDSDGFGRFVSASVTPPADGAYLRMKAGYTYDGMLHVTWPIDRFYMNEVIAPRAEAVYWEENRPDGRTIAAEIRVRKGFAVIKDVYIDGVPLADYVRSLEAGSPE